MSPHDQNWPSWSHDELILTNLRIQYRCGSAIRLCHLLGFGDVRDIDRNKAKGLSRIDLLAEQKGGDLVHIHFQMRDKDPLDMVERHCLLRRAMGKERVINHVGLVVRGPETEPAIADITDGTLAFTYHLRDIRDLDPDMFLSSNNPREVALSLLCRHGCRHDRLHRISKMIRSAGGDQDWHNMISLFHAAASTADKLEQIARSHPDIVQVSSPAVQRG